MLACQIPIALGVWLMSTADPTRGLGPVVALALFVAVLSATQDIAIDAWRIEVSLNGAGLGIMAAAYQWGYRIAVLVGGAVPLVLAGPFGWNLSYAAMATFMGIGVAATLAAPREPREHSSSPGRTGVKAALGEPLREFFRRHGSGAALALALVCVYRLPDLVRSIMGPFYLDLGFTLVEVAEIRRVFGMVMTMAGVAAGGFAVVRFGVARSLVAGAVVVTASSLGFAWLTFQGRDVPALVVTTGLECAAAGFAATCLIAYMSTLTSPEFAATQFALLSSIFSLPGRLLASQSGVIVEAAARAAERDGPLSLLGPLFTGLPAHSYSAATYPAALGAGYLVFFLYDAALGTMAVALAVRIARAQAA
jgi:PAT family beta-lactamase induction signal transducer AmpG